jgi:hypothetical protein
VTWALILKLLLSVADKVATYLTQDQLLEAGEALANSRNLTRALDAARNAQHARDVIGDNLARDPTWVPPPTDPNRRQ